MSEEIEEKEIEVICDGCGKKEEGTKTDLVKIGWCITSIFEFCPKCN
jgi:hypothetical protein